MKKMFLCFGFIILLAGISGPVSAANLISNFSAKYNFVSDTIEVKGNYPAGSTLVLMVLNNSSAATPIKPEDVIEQQAAAQVKCIYECPVTSTDGNFTFSFKFDPNTISDTYTIYACEKRMSTPQAATFAYLNPADQIKTIRPIINSATSGNIIQRIEENAIYLGLDLTEFHMAGLDQQAAMVLFLGIRPQNGFETAGKIVTAFHQAIALQRINQETAVSNMDTLLKQYASILQLDLAKYNNLGINSYPQSPEKTEESIKIKKERIGTIFIAGTYSSPEVLQRVLKDETALADISTESRWGDVKTMMTGIYQDVIVLGSDYQTKYQNLSQKDNVFKNIAGTNFTTVDELISTYKRFIDEQASSESRSSGGSSRGGSGKGGGSSTSTIYASQNVLEVLNPPEVKKPVFIDLDTVPWAVESIEALASSEIISIPEDGAYNPDKKVTREEFVKMLVSAFKLSDGNAVAEFNDVAKNDWFYPYIASAKELDIVNGITDDTFGVGREITRQEMAVLAFRAVKQSGKNIETAGNSISFIDSSDIADYAVDAIGAMKQAGIIKGMDDGRFAPHDSSTRAQAAIVINGLLQYVK